LKTSEEPVQIAFLFIPLFIGETWDFFQEADLQPSTLYYQPPTEARDDEDDYGVEQITQAPRAPDLSYVELARVRGTARESRVYLEEDEVEADQLVERDALEKR